MVGAPIASVHSVTASGEGEFSLLPEDFAGLLQLSPDFVRSATASESWPDFRFRPLSKTERDGVVLKVIQKLQDDSLSRSGSDNLPSWERGWGDILASIRQKGYQPDLLRPQYFNHDVLRWAGDYVRVRDRAFEYHYYTVVRRILFRKYLAACPRIVEFGCGTGTSLVLLMELFPGISLTGCDWAAPSQEILKEIARHTDRNVSGVRFDMFHPARHEDLDIGTDTAVITMHAMEQLGDSYGPMLDYLLASGPGICLHLEPLIELYDPSDLFDYLAIQYHRKRGYLTGFLASLRTLRDLGRVEILEERRLRFGSLFHEGYSLVAWKPRK